MYGILLIIMSLFLKNTWIYAIGIGLFVDEIPSPLLSGKTYADYYSKKSLVLLGILVLIIFFLRKLISLPLQG
jgi:hypothetical protein